MANDTLRLRKRPWIASLRSQWRIRCFHHPL